MRGIQRRRLAAVGVLVLVGVVVLIGARAERQPTRPDLGPPPLAEVLETGRAGGVPVARHDGRLPVVSGPGDLRVAITPWMAARFGSEVLDEAAEVLSPTGSRLRVRYVVRTMPTRSDLSVTGARLQIGRCGGYHGLAQYRLHPPRNGAAPDTVPTVPVATGRVHVCGATFSLDHDQQVALLVHETAHLLGLGHVCEGRACLQGDPPGCTHLMAGRWWHDCPGPIDLTSLEAAIEELYPIAPPAALGPVTDHPLSSRSARAFLSGGNGPAGSDEPATEHRRRS